MRARENVLHQKACQQRVKLKATSSYEAEKRANVSIRRRILYSQQRSQLTFYRHHGVAAQAIVALNGK